MKVDLKRCAPLGLDGALEVKYIGIGLGVCAIWALCGFLTRFTHALDSLYYYFPGAYIRELRPGAVMENFFVLMGGSELLFSILGLCMLVLAAYHYWYHRQGAMTVYLMRRLPDRWEYHRRCLAIPVAAVIVSLALMGLIGIISYAIYILRTPAQCLPV